MHQTERTSYPGRPHPLAKDPRNYGDSPLPDTGCAKAQARPHVCVLMGTHRCTSEQTRGEWRYAHEHVIVYLLAGRGMCMWVRLSILCCVDISMGWEEVTFALKVELRSMICTKPCAERLG